MTYAVIGAWCETLVWVLCHSLWQAAVVAVIVWLALRQLPARRANLRYAAAALGLAGVLLGALVTWSVLRLEPVALPAVSPPPPMMAPVAIDRPAPRSDTPLSAPSVVATSSRAWTTWLAGMWLVGTLLILGRRSASLVRAQRWAATSAGLAGFDLGALKELTRELSMRLGLRRAVRLIVSEQVRVPAVVGTLAPCILLPVSMLSGMPVAQWRIILAHELAHVRRYDEVVNLVQILIESLLFFNPAVWWLSRQVRIEREACCDALAVAVSGPPLSVARTLVEVAASLHEMAALPAPALAIAQSERAGELTDRVQRLVDPERAARPSVSRFGLAGVLIALLFAGAVLQQGTDLAVRAAAELLSPRERVERLARLQAEENGVFLAPATSAGKKKAAAPQEAGQEKVKITLVVRTEDGTPLPKDLYLSSLSVTGNKSEGGSLESPVKQVQEYRKTLTFPPCRLRVAANAPGFAAAVSPIVNLFAGAPEKIVELVLKRGSKATLKVTDDEDRPIARAALTTIAHVSIAGSYCYNNPRTFKADEHGVMVLDHIGDIEYSQELRAAGFQRADRVGVLDVTAPMHWRMKKARPTPIKVIDAASGAPIAKARFELVSWQRPSHSQGYDDPRQRKEASALTYAQTDADGRAVLDELRDDTSYFFGVLAPGYGMSLLEGVQAGQPERVIRMRPPLTLAGHVTGAIDRLPHQQHQGKVERYLYYSKRLSNLVNHCDSVTVDATGRFEITGLASGENVTIRMSEADLSKSFLMRESRRDVELKIPELVVRKFPKREVVIRVVGAAPGAAARGTLWINTTHADLNCPDLFNGSQPITDNEVRLSLPVGAQLSFEPRNLAGYVIEASEGVAVTPGAGPQFIDAPARPAGGIHGAIVRADGSPATGGFVTVFAGKLPPGEQDHRRLNPSSSYGASTFLFTVPLGGRYRILARESSDTSFVWAVSEEVVIDEKQPIAKVRLVLPQGKPLRIKVLDPEGRPVANQPIKLEIGFSQREPAYSFSSGLERRTGADGVAVFDGIALDADISPLRVSFYVTAPPTRFIGSSRQIDPQRPVVLRLRRGLSAAGVLIDAESGKPIPRAAVRIVPRDFSRAQFKVSIETTTNERGEFHFDGLEDMAYSAYIDGTVPKGTIVTRNGNGTSFRYPEGVEQPSLRAGNQQLHWEVSIYPGSPLRSGD
jgi:beta-lactamase regulating signal transducer with metallopeptidase domain